MKLINNRFRVTGVINEGAIEESYIIKDLQENEKVKFLTIYNGGRNKRVIDYFTEEYLSLINIKHKYLVELGEFGIIDTINLKKSGSLMNYYVLNEYIRTPKLADLKEEISLSNILKIILDLMCVIDYLHFRGFSYKHLSPTNIFIYDNYKVKIKDLATITRDYMYSHHNNLTEMYIAPEIFADGKDISRLVDYYSIGMIMKYLLFKGLNIEDNSKNSFKDEFNLTNNQKIFLQNMVSNLTHKDPTFRNINLKNHIKNILEIFKLDYDYDLVKERDNLILNTKMIGRDKEIGTLLDIEDSLSKGTKKFNGAIITGRPGSGKTKLLQEIAIRYGLLNRSVFHIKGREDLITGGLSIQTLLKSSFKYSPNQVINKYNNDFSELLNTDANDDIKYGTLNHKSSQEKYMIFNRLTNYFADLSKDRTIYILIDDIYTANDDFINFLNYMIFKLENDRIFLIITSIDPVLVNNSIMKKNLKLLLDSDSILHLELEDLPEVDTGEFIKNILGINFIPVKFVSFIYKESLGNPNYIYYVIKDIYNREELYMSENGSWDTVEKDYSKIIISNDENHVINKQLESISSDIYKILELISLSKDMVTRQTLVDVLKLDGESLNLKIKSLVEAKIIDDKVVEFIECLSIYSIELKRTVYSRIDYHERQRLHKELANCIMKLYADDYQLIMEELIHHLKNSDQSDYALELVLQEANNQVNRYSNYSISLWEHAYFLVKDSDNDKVLNILNTLISIYKIKGYVDLTGDHITKMQNIATRKNNIEYIILAKHHQIEMYIRSNQLDIAKSIISEVEKIINHNKGLYEGHILLLMDKVKMGFDKNQLKGVDQYLNEAIKISKDNNIQKYLGAIYNLYGLYEYLNGNSDDAIKYFNESIKAFELDSNILEEIKPINNIGNIYGSVFGDDDKALKYFQKGYKIASEYGFARISAVFKINIGDVYYQNFQLEEAQHQFETARTISNEIGEYKVSLLSNLSLGLIYLRANKFDEAYEVYTFINEINNKEPIIDSEVLMTYYTFMGQFYLHYGQFDESLKCFRLLSDTAKDFSNREYIWSEANILIIKAIKYSEYNRDKLEDIINQYQLIKMNSFALEVLLLFGILAIENEDFDFAKKILDIYSDNKGERDNEGLSILRDIIDACINTSGEKLFDLERYTNKNNIGDCQLYFHSKLSEKWTRLGNCSSAISHNLKALDSLLKIAENIHDKHLRYSFINKWGGDRLKENLARCIKLKFNKEIDYITLDDAYSQNSKYNDLIYILKQLTLIDYRELIGIDNYGGLDSLENLLFNLTDDYQKNMDMILNYLGYETLANKGYILLSNEDDNKYTIISSLNKDDICTPKENILNQSNRSDVGILINKNLRNMDDSKYIDLLPEDAVAIICVPLFKSYRDISGNDRRKGTRSYIKGNAQLQNPTKIHIYLETDSFINKFVYDNLLLINHIANLVQINQENKHLRDIAVIDKLTGVLTRKHFENEIEAMMEKYGQYQGTFSLLMIDIDNFKILNDTFGHLAGDDVLSVMGSTLKQSVRSTDLVARYGGEEFVVILYDTSTDDGFEIAEKIRKDVLNIKVWGVERQVSVSIGLAQHPEHSQYKNDLISKADQALYNAKEIEGKNCTVVWNIDMSEGTNNHDNLAGILTGNINKDNVNISAVINTVALIDNKLSKVEKISEFTKKILELLEAQYATFIEIQDSGYIHNTKVRNNQAWVKTPKLNNNIISRAIQNKKGEFLIDWDNIELLDPITEEPQWQSVLVLPLIMNGFVLGIIYLSVPLKEKEFTFEDLNLGGLLTKIFATTLSHE